MVTVARFFLSFVRRGVGASERDFFETQQEITTLTVIWARQLLSPQPKLGPVRLCRNMEYIAPILRGAININIYSNT